MHPHLRLSLLSLLLISGGCGATVGRDLGGVPNFATVDPAPDAIYRGGQPSRAGFRTLKDMGVKTVIDLRDDAVEWEKEVVSGHGMKYVHIPSNAARTSKATIARFLAAVARAERPIYVHCKRGRDRTGLEIACYRLVHQRDQWTRQNVIDELRRHGQQRLFFPGIERFLLTFDPSDFVPAPAPAGAPADDTATAGG
ncbi:MAG TPA: tyrosine-protein phosphatase [Tepidisphaeraceae bacterium]|nr:tyrosine-protein phosphatase [Tepidisphaeraceae bacterium]